MLDNPISTRWRSECRIIHVDISIFLLTMSYDPWGLDDVAIGTESRVAYFRGDPHF
jgi:hypothetical protein